MITFMFFIIFEFYDCNKDMSVHPTQSGSSDLTIFLC